MEYLRNYEYLMDKTVARETPVVYPAGTASAPPHCASMCAFCWAHVELLGLWSLAAALWCCLVMPRDARQSVFAAAVHNESCVVATSRDCQQPFVQFSHLFLLQSG